MRKAGNTGPRSTLTQYFKDEETGQIREVMSVPQMARIMGVTTVAIYKEVARGLYPKPFLIGNTGYLWKEVAEQIIAERAARGTSHRKKQEKQTV